MNEGRDEQAELVRLRNRIDELLVTIVKVTNETPYPEELKGWESQRGKMIALIGTLRARITELIIERDLLQARIEELEASK
jgi:hypothetical protein